jgi:hypothetical protein
MRNRTKCDRPQHQAFGFNANPIFFTLRHSSDEAPKRHPGLSRSVHKGRRPYPSPAGGGWRAIASRVGVSVMRRDNPTPPTFRFAHAGDPPFQGRDKGTLPPYPSPSHIRLPPHLSKTNAQGKFS